MYVCVFTHIHTRISCLCKNTHQYVYCADIQALNAFSSHSLPLQNWHNISLYVAPYSTLRSTQPHAPIAPPIPYLINIPQS